MAQHIPIKAFKQKNFRRIEAGIRSIFRGITCVRGSLVWEFSYEQGDIEVYFRDYYVGKGFVWGSNYACFEVHYNRIKRSIDEIYLVA
jgi:hypothetical protein